MSVAFLLLIRERMTGGESWDGFVAREEAFIDAGLDPVRTVYRARQLESRSAREKFELPESDGARPQSDGTQLRRDL